jgi:hypothetical protein
LPTTENISGNVEKAASGVLAILPCSRTPCTLRASKWLRPCWTDFFEHSLQLIIAVSAWACICHGNEIFNSPYHENDKGLHEKKWRELLLIAVAGKFLGVIVAEALSRALLGLWLAN